MTDEDVLARCIAKCVAAVVLGLIATIGGCQFGQYAVYAHSMNVAIEKGADPLRAGCAYGAHGSAGDTAICTQMISETRHVQ
jgi:hypothetical protein